LKALACYRLFWWCLAEPQPEVAYEIVICDLLKPMKPIITIISIIIGPHYTIFCAAFSNPGVLCGKKNKFIISFSPAGSWASCGRIRIMFASARAKPSPWSTAAQRPMDIGAVDDITIAVAVTGHRQSAISRRRRRERRRRRARHDHH